MKLQSREKIMIRILIITILFGISYGLANHFSKNNLQLPDKWTQWLSSLFTEEKEVSNIVSNACEVSDKTPPKPSKLNTSSLLTGKKYHHVEVGRTLRCSDTSIGEITYKSTGGTYSWIDEQGVFNESKTHPTSATGDLLLTYKANKQIKEYFTLNLLGDELPAIFEEKLYLRLNVLFEIYEKLINPESFKKIALNFYVYRDKAQFEQKKEEYYLSESVRGFYSHDNNSSYFLYDTYAKSIDSAVHEATHAINRGLIGVTPKWLNEGLSEYSENINQYEKDGPYIIIPKRQSIKKRYLTAKLLPLSVLMRAKKNDWKSNLSSRLYETSWAFIHFMMEDKKRKQQLVEIIKAEQIKPCTSLSKERVEDIMIKSLLHLQEEFNAWSKSTIKVHDI
jgi:hypothetical protein